jgi:hypothetical protein
MAVVAPRDLVSDEVANSPGRGPIGGVLGGFLGQALGGSAGEGNAPVSGESPWSLSPSRASADTVKRAIALVLAGVSVFLGLLLIVSTIKDPTYEQNSSPASPIDGLTIFAVFFVAAFSIERLLEPLSTLLIPKQDVSDDLSTSMEGAKDATLSFYRALAMHNNAAAQLAAASVQAPFSSGPTSYHGPTSLASEMLKSSGLNVFPDTSTTAGALRRAWSAFAVRRRREDAPPLDTRPPLSTYVAKATEGAKTTAEEALQAATETLENAQEDAQRKLGEAAAALEAYRDRDYIRTVIFWAVATIVAMLGSASLNLYFLQAVGVSSASRWLEVLATGLIIGAGTKPLHDLTTALSARKELT